ncbi:Uncharacterised protein [Mycobacterium tuberculosis]|nr:Uncharacterised protein [Mycobacterium tuberculosis]
MAATSFSKSCSNGVWTSVSVSAMAMALRSSAAPIHLTDRVYPRTGDLDH